MRPFRVVVFVNGQRSNTFHRFTLLAQVKTMVHHVALHAQIVGQLGIEQQRVKLAKEQSAMWYQLLIGVLARLDIPADDPRLPVVVAEVVAELEQGT